MHLYYESAEPLSESELKHVRQRYCEILRTELSNSSLTHRYIELLAEGDGTKKEIVWWGLVHDALMVVVVVMFAISLRHRIKASAEQRRTARRDRAIAAGKCPACGYDIRASQNICPECGEDVTRRPPLVAPDPLAEKLGW